MEQAQTSPATEQPPVLVPSQLPDEVKEFLDHYNFSMCMICGACSNGCPITGTPGFEEWNIRRVLRMLAMGMLQEVVDSKFPWLCTGCGRCAEVCPMSLDIPALMGHMKHLRPKEKKPGSVQKGADNNVESGNNLAIPMEDYLQGMCDLGIEMAEEDCPGFYVPVDKKNAKILFFPNSKEVYGDYEDQYWWWRIFYAAREDWTVPSKGWEAVDWALFSGDYDANKKLAQRKIDYMIANNIERMIMPDCGGGSYGCRKGMERCISEDPDNEVGYIYLYDYLKEIMEAGRIKVHKAPNEGKRFTFHDSCKHCRELARHFSRGFFEEPRWIIRQCVDDFVDMTPNRELNYCCGAGGGMWPLPFDDESAWQGRRKVEQIKRTGADVVVVGCSNCRDQIMKRLPKYYPEVSYETKYIWQLVAESLVIAPWSEEEVKKGEAEGTAQWERFGIEPDTY